MDHERLRWITRPPTLDRWAMSVSYSDTPSGTMGTITMQGHCDRKRGALWIYTATEPVEHRDYALSDHVHHLTLVCNQVRPVTEQSLQRGLVGGYWDQPELPF